MFTTWPPVLQHANICSSPSLNRKQPVEKGPFGRATNRRSTSRSKTATPATRDDLLRIENNKYQDEIFNKFKADLEDIQKPQQQQGSRAAAAEPALQRTTSFSLANPRSIANIASPPAPSVSSAIQQATAPSTLAEPTEVLLYGFGSAHQHAAIAFFESTSGGRIYEDYDRHPPTSRFATAVSASRSLIPRNIPRTTLRKINEYKGGDHWIKVTLDSPEAAQRACDASPHIVNGYRVSAEMWRGVPPQTDTAISASGKSAGTVAEPRRRPTNQSQSHSTMPSRTHSTSSFGVPFGSSMSSQDSQDTSVQSSTVNGSATTTGSETLSESSATLPASSQVPTQRRSLRITNARPLALQPSSLALLPVPPWTTRAFGHLPLIGSFFGGDVSHTQARTSVIGSTIPRNEKGEFDWNKATLWWQICYTIDQCLGSDICGMKGDD